MLNKNINSTYNSTLKLICKLIGHNKTTTNFELNRIGKTLFNNKFAGCFPIDKIPKLNSLQKYCILNLDNSRGSGSHWISCVFDNGNYILYDSFGRCHTKIINKKYIKRINIINTDIEPSNMDQKVSQFNCGQRALAALVIYDLHGLDFYMKL